MQIPIHLMIVVQLSNSIGKTDMFIIKTIQILLLSKLYNLVLTITVLVK